MTSRDFCYWLQGFFEITKADGHKLYITSEQADMIQKHLNMVFYHEIDPSHGDEKHQGKLNAIHSGHLVLTGANNPVAQFQDGTNTQQPSLTAEPEQLEFDFMKENKHSDIKYRC